LWFPVGVAHGFQALQPDTEVTYLLGAEHKPDDERVIALDDPDLAISWPMPIGERSDRDRAAPSLREVEPLLATWFPEHSKQGEGE
jgi:dTDP-4-dehydrorhamnose 3,5-epimerase